MSDSSSCDPGKRRAAPRLLWVLPGLAGASLLLLLGMLPAFESWSPAFALAAIAFGAALMLLPTRAGRPSAGWVVAVGSMGLGILAVYGVIGTEQSGDAFVRLACMLVFFWILPLVALSLDYARRFEAEKRECGNLEEPS